MFYNGYYRVMRAGNYYLFTPEGEKVNGVYGDDVSLTNSGRWKCVRNGRVYLKD